MRIGMTGGIGAGKNAAAEIFKKYGFHVIDADELARSVSAPGSEVNNRIAMEFGPEALLSTGEVNRPKLASVVFEEPRKRKLLENIVHPAVFKAEERLRKKIKAENSRALIITHAALLIESGAYVNYHPLITVYAPLSTRIKRAALRQGIKEEDVAKRAAAQATEEERLEAAHIIIDNSGDITNLAAEVKRAAELIKQLVYAEKHSLKHGHI